MVELPREPKTQASTLLRLLSDEQADGVIERYSLKSGPARRATAQLGLPLILEVNAPLVLEAARHRGLTDIDTWLRYEELTFSSADAIGAVSTALVRYVNDKVDDAIPCRWIPNAADATMFRTATPARLGLPEGNVVVGFVGSMKRWHGVLDLIEAMRRLGPSVPIHLVIAGTGPEWGEAEGRVESSGLAERVHLIGQLAHRDVPALLRALDAGIAPYTPEADFYFCPLKVLEYLAAALPVVCPAIGDIPSLAEGAGLYYSAGDVNGLTDVLRNLVDQPERRHAAVVEAERQARQWTWDANAAAYEELLQTAPFFQPAAVTTSTAHGLQR
jgi:glycosyltransferase involved in cell wall biosynthesis